MPDLSSISQVVQIGVEATPGTSVAATRKLAALSIEPNIDFSSDIFRPMGQKFGTLQIPGKEFVTAALSGRATYDELPYVLASVMNYAAPVATTPAGGFVWTFSPSPSGVDTIKTYTVEVGNSIYAKKFTYGLINEFGLTISRENVEISGGMIGQQFQTGIALSGGATIVNPLTPIIPDDFDIYLADTQAGLAGATKEPRAYSLSFNLGNRYSTVWPLDSSLASFAGHVEAEPSVSMTLKMSADAAGHALLTKMRAGDTKFIRAKTQGPLIVSGTPNIYYTFQLDAAVKVSKPNQYSDEDGVYMLEWDLAPITDATWNKAFEIVITNKLTAL